MKELIEMLRNASLMDGDAMASQRCEEAADAIESQAATIALYETTAENCDGLRAKVDEQAREIERLTFELDHCQGVATNRGLEIAALKAIEPDHSVRVRELADNAVSIGLLKPFGRGIFDALANIQAGYALLVTPHDPADGKGYSMQIVEAAAQCESSAVPLECRQRLAAEGKAYPKSSCAVCGQFSPKWKECDSLLAALKAQPSGVVLPNRRVELKQTRLPLVAAEIKGWNKCLDKVARLNSSHVSAGGVDERAAFETWAPYRIDAHNGVYESQRTSDGWNAWQARAALAATAPSHSEQVREVDYKRKFECLVEHAKRQDQVISELRYDKNIRRFYDDGAVWFWAGDETDNLETLACPVVINAGDLRALLAAAPSAGSQKEQE